MSRKPKYIKKPYETYSQSDVSANIFDLMLRSDAWQDLTAGQKALYVVCNVQRYAEPSKYKPDGQIEYFTMSRGKWSKTYKLYAPSNTRGFMRDMAALIEHGFVSCVSSGANTREKNVYKLSDRWTKYGTPEFKTAFADMTTHMQREYRHKQEENEI